MKRLFIIMLLLSIPMIGISQTLEDINTPTVAGLDQIGSFSEGLAAVRKGNEWGFINEEGKLIIDFRGDLVWNRVPNTAKLGVENFGYPQFKNGLCAIKVVKEDGITRYGFLDKKGTIAIPAEFLNVSQFSDGHTIGIYEKKVLRGKNPFKLRIYQYDFTEVVVNKEGEMIWPIQERQGIVMSEKLYELPEIHAAMISDKLLMVKDKTKTWNIVKPKL
jgi:hypothetical protein